VRVAFKDMKATLAYHSS